MTAFELLLTLVAVLAGAVAAISGFGIGSLLTPVLTMHVDTRTAVASITIPHLVATAIRFWQLRKHVDWAIVRRFGITSAAGGLVGAILHNYFQSVILTGIFAALLLFAGFSGVTGLSSRMQFRGPAAWIAGAFSGLFGGLVGNQGGIRSAAMLGFDVSRETFVGTATATALLVDGARFPVYLATDGHRIAMLWPQVLCMVAGVVAGTFLGRRLLRHIPESVFRRVVAAIILALGFWMAVQAWTEWR